jgi:hypothetical protein
MGAAVGRHRWPSRATQNPSRRAREPGGKTVRLVEKHPAETHNPPTPLLDLNATRPILIVKL